MLRLFALAVLLCLALPTGGDARPIDWRPEPLPVATVAPEPAFAPTVVAPPCSPDGAHLQPLR